MSLPADVLRAVGLPVSLGVVLAVYVVVVTSRAALSRVADILLMRLRLGFVDHMRHRLYEAIGRARWDYLARERSSDFSHVLTTDIGRVGAGAGSLLDLAVGSAVASIQLLIALQLSWTMTVISASVGGLLLFILIPQIRRAQDLGETLTRANRGLFGTVTQFLDGLKLAKSYGMEDRHVANFDEAVAALREPQLRFQKNNSLARLAYQVATVVVLGGLVYAAAEVVELPPAELLLLLALFSRLLPTLARLQSSYQGLVQMLPAYGSAIDMLDACIAHAESPSGHVEWSPVVAAGVRLRGVSFRYPSATTDAVHQVDLDIPAHRTTALVGPSGAGKTTMADIVMGLLVPDAGQVEIDGELLVPGRLMGWRRAISYVPQDSFLFHDTLRANLAWACPGSDDARLWEALRLASAQGFVADMPEGLATVLGDRGVRLSGGERQRVALARALVRRPALLVLDEATSALDSENERLIRQALDELHGELTILIIAHRLSTVRSADQIAVLDAGRVVEVGRWEELLGRVGGRFAALVAAAGASTGGGLIP